MATRVTSSTFVGRSVQLAELEAALADAADTRPSLAFVAGDSGVGKTRLVSEVARRARASGARVLSGDCIELGEGELPYVPIVAALRVLSRAHDPVLDELPDVVRAELATLMPEISPRPDERTPDVTAQGRLFEALLTLLDRLGQDAPVVLIIEDLHWADRATRAFMAFLGRSLCRERVVVVATYRTDELHRRHPLRPLLAELERDARARRIELPPFTREELTEQLLDILGAAPDDELVARVFARSEGHPLFVEELMAAGLDGRGALPPTLRDALMLRIERLPDPAQAVLRVIAVGQQLDDELVEEVTGMERPELHETLREAVASHIIEVNREGRYVFRHALLREVVQDDLLPGERAAIDLQLARALEARAERDGLSVYLAVGIAHHYLSAGNQPEALRAAFRAAIAAERVHANSQAAALLERAAGLFDLVPDAEEIVGVDKVRLLACAAFNHRLDNDAARQEATARAAIALLDEREHPHRVAGLLERLADAQWALGRGNDAIATTKHALSLLPPDEPSRERALLLSQHAKSLMLRGKLKKSVAVAREVLDVVDTGGIDTPVIRSRALNALGTSLMGLGEVDEGAAILRNALDLARAEESIWHIGVAYVNLADALHLAGRLREARAVAEEGAVEELRQHDNWMTILRAELAMEAGDLEEGERLLRGVRLRRVGTLLINLNLRRSELALTRGDHESARGLLEEASELVGEVREPQWISVLAVLTAELERREGNLDAARRAIAESLDAMETCTDDLTRLARVSATGATVEADAAQRACDLGEEEDARAALLAADMHVVRSEAAAERDGPMEVAWLLSARAERTRAAGASDPAAYAAAADAWDALERPRASCGMRVREAEAHAEVGDREAACAAARRAHEIAAGMGADWLRGEIEGLAARARLDLGEGVPAATETDEDAAAEDPFGLTPRERQVLELVARGATNREIGAELFMAEKTASVHVSRILAKLDVRTRTEAAGVAHRLRLVA